MHRSLEYRSFDTKGDFNESAFNRVALVDREALRLNTTLILSANERFDYYLADSEVITFEIDAVGASDAEVILRDGGTLRRYRTAGGSHFGLMISCGN